MRAKRAAERAGAGVGKAGAVMDRPTPSTQPTPAQIAPEPEQPVKHREPLRLNLGAGRFRVDGWQSVDIVPEFNPDYVEDVSTLPSFYPGSVGSIYCGHVVEHLDDPVAAFLRWFEVLKPGGGICISMPDHRKTVELWSRAERFPVLTDQPLTGLLAVTTGFYSFAQYQEMKAKNPQAAQAQMHRRSLDVPILMALLQATGFEDIEQIDETAHECAPKFGEFVNWQMVIRGRKPSNG